jgi:uncharacterized protein YuzE
MTRAGVRARQPLDEVREVVSALDALDHHVDEEVVLYYAEHGVLGITVTEAQARVVPIGDDIGVRRRRLTVERGRPWLAGGLGEGRPKALEHPFRDLLQALAAGTRLGGDPPRPDLEVRLRLGLRHSEVDVAAR